MAQDKQVRQDMISMEAWNKTIYCKSNLLFQTIFFPII